jgi:hypothetical protein
MPFSVIALNAYAECHNAEGHYAGDHNAECLLSCVKIKYIMQNVILLNVIMLNVIMLNVVAPPAILLNIVLRCKELQMS